ncbi:glycosyltransferase family 2 protein [Anabaena sp. FACHB-709]|uniref:Glucosyltransferase n=2 Tax=Nostocaceae TaxID=1162 RepID=A0A1Z4KG16_ANAVA|nr:MULTISPECIES: glycosyltransferase family A protein [Nostocaceae]BAY67914.1 glucosyltransferase [Trichormus variabilis NIES-23]HBW29662.1 glycosyltransferase family 2 protein [Nostoc sp. UBA8866]MBD2169996.1 glycosyltransferase family 2 protein [Anabaena cylindrica FACHB-318]MBD2261584.1 glycosyltransferase family 2 protein [Anabaena sp. FACHB-709]MBD2271168.1 glycosyltransferase family 2 protein [Nostoc sp. PCC 7120 = FACHB-418]
MTHASILISVIIPAYNAAKFLPDAIASVEKQTFTDWELLIINDGSTDDTIEVVREHQKTSDCIYLINQTNQGVSAARNQGVAHSQGQIIAFLDADDQWLPDKLSQHWQHFQSNSRLGVSFAQVEILDQAGEPTGQVSTSRLNDLKPEYFLSENPTTTTSNWVIRKEVFTQVGGFCLDMSYSEDLEWLLRVSSTTDWQIQGINQVLTRYRTSSSGLSSNLYYMEAGWKQLVNRARIYAPQLVHNHFALAQAVHLRYLARRAFRLKLPARVGVDFITRALISDWRLLFHQPQRTFFTLLAVFGALVMERVFGLNTHRGSTAKAEPFRGSIP